MELKTLEEILKRVEARGSDTNEKVVALMERMAGLEARVAGNAGLVAVVVSGLVSLFTAFISRK